MFGRSYALFQTKKVAPSQPENGRSDSLAPAPGDDRRHRRLSARRCAVLAGYHHPRAVLHRPGRIATCDTLLHGYPDYVARSGTGAGELGQPYVDYFNVGGMVTFDGALVVVFILALVVAARVAERSGLGKALRIGED
jgi:hypothetical protein